ncbi:MAG: hypothetical protein BroJett013_12000 [Alphaproteobacteria bacterium]|nr:MAG: hypothetical protein BroJett013_12000 [Alphaproteobacteria bacterium]
MTLKSIQRRAGGSITPNSYKAGPPATVGVTFTTFADVNKGSYIERVTREGLDLSRLVGASVLIDHDASSVRNVIGVVLAAKRDGTATLQLSDRPDVAPIVADIAAGVIRHISFEASVSQWRESVDPKSRARVKTAERWTPHELSFVAVPADPGATTRSHNMDPELENAPEQPATETPANEPATVTRNQAIRSLCRQNRMTREFEDSLIDGEGGLIEARAAVEAEIQRRTPRIRATVGVDHADPAAIMQRQIGALSARATGATPKDDEREFAHLSIIEHADTCLQRRGISTRGMPADQRIQRAIGTGDLPELLTGVGNRSLQTAYQLAAAPVVQLAVKKTLTDFRPASFLRAGEFDDGLDLLTEHGEIKYTARTESKETIQLDTYARGVNYTMRAIINDDLGALTDATAQFGQKAAAKDADVLLAVLNANAGAGPQMDDGENLFSAAHDNIDTGDTPITVHSVGAARLAMRSIVSADGETLLAVTPKYLVVGKGLETKAEQFLASINPTNNQDANPFAGKLTLMVEPRLADYEWQIWADPAQAPVLALARLAGREAPQIEQQQAWTTWGVSFRCIHHVAAAAIGWRGAYKFVNGQDSNSEV